MSDAFWLLASAYLLQMACSGIATHLAIRHAMRQMKINKDNYDACLETWRINDAAKEAAIAAVATQKDAAIAERDAWCARYNMVQQANDGLSRRLEQYEGTIRHQIGEKGSIQ